MCKKKNLILSFLGLMLVLNMQILQAKSVSKVVFVPERDIKKHGLNVSDGRFGYDYKAESENLVLFWEKSFGKDPAINMDESKRFYPDEILIEGERYYNYFADNL